MCTPTCLMDLFVFIVLLIDLHPVMQQALVDVPSWRSDMDESSDFGRAVLGLTACADFRWDFCPSRHTCETLLASCHINRDAARASSKYCTTPPQRKRPRPIACFFPGWCYFERRDGCWTSTSLGWHHQSSREHCRYSKILACVHLHV